ncbi:MAG: putative porin [Lentisphaeria bacterium]|nr:putative porin [Lentisphaeria bacterium]
MKLNWSRNRLLSALGMSAWLVCQALPAEEKTDPQEQIRQLQEMVRQQGERLAALEAMLASQQQAMTTLAQQQATVAAAVQSRPEAKGVLPVVLGKGTDQLRLTGDFRLRYEAQSREGSGVSGKERDRFLPRLRVGLVWTSSDWEVGAGVATGGIGATGTNDTWGDTSPFQTDDLRLDYAYAHRKWGDFGLVIGQQKNPFLGTLAVWDSDVRPTGITGQYQAGPWFVTAGAYNVRHYGWDEGNANLGAIQTGLQGTHGNLSGKIAFAWYQFNHATIDPNNATTKSNQPTLAVANDDYDLTLGSVYAEGSYKGDGWKGTLYGEYTRNFAADGTVGQVKNCVPGDNDTAWVLGASLAIRKVGFDYAYAHIEADSVYGQINDATFGGPLGTTDVEGHVFGVSYALTDRLKLTAQAYLMDPIERTDRKDGRVFLADATWKF